MFSEVVIIPLETTLPAMSYISNPAFENGISFKIISLNEGFGTIVKLGFMDGSIDDGSTMLVMILSVTIGGL